MSSALPAQPPENADWLEEERRDLIEIAESLAALAPALAPQLDRWRKRVETDLGPGTRDDAARELRADELWATLRAAWRRAARSYTDGHWLSPHGATRPALPGGVRLEYTYERGLRPLALEARLAAARPSADGWESNHVALSSGMAALSVVLQGYAGFVRAPPRDPLRVWFWGGYFETELLLDMMRGPGLVWQKPPTQDALLEGTLEGACDVLVLEPVSYDWEMQVLDMERLLEAWVRRPSQRPSVIVLDVSLTGPLFPLAELLEVLRDTPPKLLAVLTSGNKLDQGGLELCNVGFLSLYTRVGSTPTATQFAGYLRTLRTTLGITPSLDEVAMLQAPFVLEPRRAAAFAGALFRSNELLATSGVRAGGLFSRIVHPARTGERAPWAVGPFVVFHLTEDTPVVHGFLHRVLDFEARRRRLSLVRGASFGFRGHRYETIVPKRREGGWRGLFKVALGARPGPSRAGTIELLEELTSFPDAAALMSAYTGRSPAYSPR